MKITVRVRVGRMGRIDNQATFLSLKLHIAKKSLAGAKG